MVTYGPAPLGNTIIPNATLCVGDVGGSEVGRFRRNRTRDSRLSVRHLTAISNEAVGQTTGVFEASYRES